MGSSSLRPTRSKKKNWKRVNDVLMLYDNFTLNAPDGNRYWIDPQPFYMNVDFSGQVLTSNQ
ncbi:MAG: hypothetical protein LUQ22_01700 [Methanotrichaceae archaeon]|nr:hypothetical protein [Methanotrichaceae archaeon]